MTVGSSIEAITFTLPPQCSHTSMSILKTRFRRCIQVIAKDGIYAGFAGAKTGHCLMALFRRSIDNCLRFLTPFARRQLSAVFAVGRKDTVVASKIASRFGNQCGELGHEV